MRTRPIDIRDIAMKIVADSFNFEKDFQDMQDTFDRYVKYVKESIVEMNKQKDEFMQQLNETADNSKGRCIYLKQRPVIDRQGSRDQIELLVIQVPTEKYDKEFSLTDSFSERPTIYLSNLFSESFVVNEKVPFEPKKETYVRINLRNVKFIDKETYDKAKSIHLEVVKEYLDKEDRSLKRKEELKELLKD